MKRIGSKGTCALTLLHKLVGLAWVIAAVGILVITVPAATSEQVAWGRVASLARAGSIASVVTLLLGFTYNLFTVWGFRGSRWISAKWGLYLVAVSASGYTIRAGREQDLTMVVTLAAIQTAALLVSMGIGVYLEKSRHAGRLPRSR